MFSLIKNELTKIFHKKAIYVIAIITILVGLMDFGVIRLSENLNSLFVNDTTISYIEEGLKNYDLSDPSSLSMYVEDKTMIDVYKASKEYNYESFEYYLLNTKGEEYLSCMNHNKYETKNDKEFNRCETEYNQMLENLKNKDWKYFVNQDKEETQKRILELENSLEKSPSEADDLKKEIKTLKTHLEGIEYSLAKNIYPSYGDKYSVVTNYESFTSAWDQTEKDEKTFTERSQLLNKRETEKEYHKYKYIIENQLDYSEGFSAKEMLISEFSGPTLFILVMVIFIAGSIVSDEYNKGTIKQLLLRPFSRTKILASKYISCLIIFLLYTCFYALVCTIAYGLASGFGSLLDPVVIYDFASSSIVEMHLVPYLLLQFVSVLPAYLIILSLAFFMSTVSGNTALSVMVPFMTYFISNIVAAFASSLEVKLLKFFPTMCWNLNEFLFGGLPSFKYSTLTTSIIISIITFLVLFIFSFVIFKKKDIKNQ